MGKELADVSGCEGVFDEAEQAWDLDFEDMLVGRKKNSS